MFLLVSSSSERQALAENSVIVKDFFFLTEIYQNMRNFGTIRTNEAGPRGRTMGCCQFGLVS